jgi:hypothetical protein
MEGYWTIVLLEVLLFLEHARANRTTIALSLLSNEPSDGSWKNKNAPSGCCRWKARGIIARNLVTGEIEKSAHAVVIASGGYGNVFSCQLMQWE